MENVRTLFGTHNPAFFEVKEIRVQAEAGKPIQDRAGWMEFDDEKRAEIDLDTEPQMRGKNPIVRVNVGSRTGSIHCEDSVISAVCVYASLVTAIAVMIGSDPSSLLRVTSASDAQVRFYCDDPQQLVRLMRRQREEGPIEAVGGEAGQL